MAHLLEKTRKITSMLKRSEEQLQDELPYNAITRQLADIIDCNACIVNSKGRLLGYFMRYKTNNDRVEQFFQSKTFPEDYVQGANMIYDTEANLPVEHDLTIFPTESRSDFPDGLTTIAPIHVSGIRLGSLIIWRNDKKFEEDEKNIRRRTAVTMAVNTLSYSELRAVSAILAELNGNEGQLTASVIADRIGITRSVIVNALRKLESAGIIESRSLGMKGTYLKVLIPDIFEEVKKRDY